MEILILLGILFGGALLVITVVGRLLGYTTESDVVPFSPENDEQPERFLESFFWQDDEADWDDDIEFD